MLRLLSLAVLGAALSGCAMPQPPANGPRAAVFFQPWSAALDASAQQVVTVVAQSVKASPTGRVWVFGYADLTGSVAANKLISATRAQMVTDQLIADGVAPERIEQAGHGATGIDQVEQGSRRVVLVTAP